MRKVRKQDLTVSQVLRRFMRDYVQPEKGETNGKREHRS
jgi:hypothetical protein